MPIARPLPSAARPMRACGILAATLLACLTPGPGQTASAAPAVVISEFMASNSRTLRDDQGITSDWIEIHNRSADTVDLGDFALTDDPSRPRRWPFPHLALGPGERKIVFASGRDRRDARQPLHASFKLSAEGDYLALTAADGQVIQSFAPRYPPQFADVSYGFAHDGSSAPWFLPQPTPGKPNLPPGTSAGPRLTDATHSPTSPSPGSPLQVAIRIASDRSAPSKVSVVYRVDHRPEETLDLRIADAATRGTATNGIWTGTVPTVGCRDGSLLRWRFVAIDAEGIIRRWPLHPNSDGPARYLGTVLNPRSVTSALPVFHLFVAPRDLEAMDSEEGTRGDFFHDGEYYDGIHIKLRGNTTAGFPKKSHRLEFAPDHPLRHPGPGGRIRNTSLMAEWGDPTYLRQHLSFWLMAQAGTPAPFHDPVRVQLNGEFFQLALHSQVLGEELLARTGLDPDGALYKAVGTVTPDQNSTGGFEKKTRRHEGVDDYVAFSRLLANPRSATNLTRALFDECDLPAVVNYLAVARLVQEDDDIWANMSLYRDSEGSGRWRPVAFDMNVSWGFSFSNDQILADEDSFRSHPFWGASGIGDTLGHNRLYDAVIRNPATRQMLLRRMRTLMDRFLQPPGTPPPERMLERHLEDLRRRMAPEAVLDRERWGIAWTSTRGSSPARDLNLGLQALSRRFVEPRRFHLYVTHAATNTARRIGIGARLNAGIPGPLPSVCPVRIAEIGRGEKPRQDWLRLSHTNAFAPDLSGWRITGDLAFTLPPGTVLPVGHDLVVAADLAGFRARTAGPKPGEQRLVVGGFRGNLGKAREIRLVDSENRPVDTWRAPPGP